jgi:pimeloyl-ACP methyl ester carboxylesterase
MVAAFLQMDEYQLYVERYSFSTTKVDSPTMIFLHDSWGCVRLWGDFPKKISKMAGLDALLYDRRGYGKSSGFAVAERTDQYLHDEAHELIRVMDAYTIEKAVIYGHSDGATIALIAAALYPERIKGLLLEGPHSFIEDSGKAAVLATRERAIENNLLASLQKYHDDKAAELFRLWHETWLSDFFSKWTIVPILNRISCPVLAFQGEDDEFGTIEQLYVLKKEISTDVILAEIRNAGHTPRKEAETETMDLLENWLETIPWLK